MATQTILVELTELVVWIGRHVIIGLVTGITGCRRIDISRGMTLDAGAILVSACEWKRGGRMVERRWRPGDVVVTEIAVVIELIGQVVGISRAVEIDHVTTVALGRRAFELSGMAICTSHSGMSTR